LHQSGVNGGVKNEFVFNWKEGSPRSSVDKREVISLKLNLVARLNALPSWWECCIGKNAECGFEK
jgi:hypothetical protein